MEGGLEILTGGTDTHLMQIDLRNSEWTGKAAEERLHEVKRHRQPQHGAVRRAAADRRVGRPHRDAGDDDARLRRGRLPRDRPDHLDALGDDARPRRRCAGASRRCARSGRSTRGSAATRPTSRDAAQRQRLTVVDASARPAQARAICATKDTPTVHFRKLANEITLLLTYEATKDLPTEDFEIETPLERMTAQRISGKKVAVCPVLRAGVGMLDGVLSLVSSARVGFIGMYRDEETLEPVQYYSKLPTDLSDARRDRPRPDARDRPLERGGDRRGEGGGRADGDARLHRRRAARHRLHPRATIPTCTSSAPRSTAG